MIVSFLNSLVKQLLKVKYLLIGLGEKQLLLEWNWRPLCYHVQFIEYKKFNTVCNQYQLKISKTLWSQCKLNRLKSLQSLQKITRPCLKIYIKNTTGVIHAIWVHVSFVSQKLLLLFLQAVTSQQYSKYNCAARPLHIPHTIHISATGSHMTQDSLHNIYFSLYAIRFYGMYVALNIHCQLWHSYIHQ